MTPVPGSARLSGHEARNPHHQEQAVCQEREDLSNNSSVK
jgi:hypothetical protein